MNTHDGWAIWRHRAGGELLLVFQVHGAVENAITLTHPSIMHWSEEVADQADADRNDYVVLWEEATP
jgi:hypothetical protein